MPDKNPIYDFMKANGLTDKDETTFLREYSDSAKAREVFGFFQANKLTDKTFDDFYGTYLKKKGSLLSGVGGVALQNGSQGGSSLLNGGGGGRKVESVLGKQDIGLKDKSDFEIEDYNKRFESVTGQPSLNLGSNLPSISKTREQKKYLKYKDIEETQINPVLSSVETGTASGQQLAELHKNPFGKKLVEKIIKENFSIPQEESIHPEDWEGVALSLNKLNRPKGVEAQNQYIYNLDNELSNSLKGITVTNVSVSGGTGGAAASVQEETIDNVGTNNPEELGRVLSTLQNATGLRKGNESVDKNGLIEKIKEKIFYLNIDKPIHPEITAISDKAKDAITRYNIARERGKKDIQTDDEANLKHFELGLNFIKDANPGMYRNVINGIEKRGLIADSDAEQILNAGQQLYNQRLFREGAVNPEVIGKETKIRYDSYQSNKAEYSKVLSEELFKMGFKDVWKVPGYWIEQAAAKHPELDNKEIINDIKLAEANGGKGIVKGGGGRAFLRGLASPIKGIEGTIDALTKSPVDNYLNSKKLDLGDQMVANKRGEYSFELPSEQGKIFNDILEGAGEFITQIGSSYLGGRLISAPYQAVSKTALTAPQKLNIAAYGGGGLSTLAQTYGSSYIDFLQKTGNPGKAKLMATFDSIGQSFMEVGILPDVKLAESAKDLFKTSSRTFAKEMMEVVEKGGSEVAKRSVLNRFLGNVAKVYGKEVLGEEVGQNAWNYLTETAFSPATANNRNIGQETVGIIKEASTKFAIPLILGAAGKTKSDNNKLSNAAINNAAINFDEFKDGLDRALINETISEEDYNTVIEIAAAHKKNIDAAPKIDAGGNGITDERQLEYALQTTRQQFLEKKMEGLDNIQKEPIEKQIKESDDIRRKIFYGESVKNLPKTEPEVKPDPAVQKDNDLLEAIKLKASETEQGEELQYFIDKAAEDPAAFMEIHDKKTTKELLEKVPTETLIENRDYLVKNFGESESTDFLNQIIKQRTSEAAGVSGSALKDEDKTLNNEKEINQKENDEKASKGEYGEGVGEISDNKTSSTIGNEVKQQIVEIEDWDLPADELSRNAAYIPIKGAMRDGDIVAIGKDGEEMSIKSPSSQLTKTHGSQYNPDIDYFKAKTDKGRQILSQLNAEYVAREITKNIKKGEVGSQEETPTISSKPKYTESKTILSVEQAKAPTQYTEAAGEKPSGLKGNLQSKGFDAKPDGVYEKNGVRFTIENDKVYEVNNGEPSKYHANKIENSAIIENIENVGADKGVASKLLDEVIQAANEEGKELQLFPRPPKGGKLNKQQLTEWYERKGFVLREDGIMVKKPEKSYTEAATPKASEAKAEQSSTGLSRGDVGEEMGGEKLPTIDEVYDILESEESRQGGSWLDNEYGDARFESEEQAKKYAEEVHSFLVGLGNEKEIPVYRAVSAEDVDLSPYGIGESWSFSLDAAKEFGRRLGVPLSKVKIISGEVPSENVDWQQAVRRYHNFSDSHSGESEFELPIPANRKIKNIQVHNFKEVKEIKNETEKSTSNENSSGGIRPDSGIENKDKGGNTEEKIGEREKTKTFIDQSLSSNTPSKEQAKPQQPELEAGKSEIATQNIGNQPPKPPEKETVGNNGEGVELSHKGLQEVANEFSLPDVRKRDRKSDIELKKEADELVNEWTEKGQYAKNVEELIKDAEAGEILTDKERVVLERHLANLSAELRGIKDKTSPEFDAKLKEIIRLKEAGEKTRSEAGAALRIPGGGSLPHPVVDFAEAVVTMKEAVGEKDLTPEQKAEVEKMVSDYEQRAKVAEEKVADMEAKFAEMQAKKATEKTKKSKTEYKSERDNIRKSIKDKWAASAKDGTLTAVAVPYAKQLMAIAPDVAKLVKSYVSEGITEFSEVVKKVHDFIKDLSADISESDVVDVIAGKYDAAKETKLDLVKKLKQIKDQKSAEAIKIRARIKSGDFAKKELPKSWVNNPEFKTKFPKEYKEAIDAIDAREQAKLDFDIAVYKAQRAQRSPGRKGIDFIRALIATTKAVKSGIDDSAVMMQNIVAMISHPRSAVKALKEHALDALSEKRFRRYLTELHESPMWPLIEKSGLDITDPKSLKEQNKEEIFDNNLLNKDIKIKGKKYNIGKYVTRPFERAFTSLGNSMRVNMFTRIAERMMEEGKTFETHPEEYKSLARVLNTETGRGKLHTQIERASQLITAGIWSPRLMSSRINMLGLSELAPLYGGKGYYAGLTPQMRKMAIADMAKFLGTGIALMAFAGSQGAGVDDDPESPTFGTIKVGNKKYNAWGGFTPYAKTIYQGVSGHRNVGGERKPIAKSKLLGSFFRSRLTPAAGVTTDLLTGEDFSGKPATAGGSIMNLIAPLSVMAMIDAVKKDGMTGVLNQGLPSFVGVGVSDERDFERGNKHLTKEEKEDPTFKYFIDKGINFPELDPKKIETKSVNGKPTEHLSDLPKETQEKYIETKKRYLKEELDNLKNGVHVILRDKNGTVHIESEDLKGKSNMETVEFGTLTKEEINYLMSSNLSKKITDKTKKEVLPDE